MNNFEKAMTFISLHEWGDRKDGGYTNDPTDPGGETKFGLSKRANPDLDIKNLTLNRAMERFKARYWTGNLLDSYPWPFSAAAFDSYIQHRPEIAKKMVEVAKNDVRALLEARRVFYLGLIAKKPDLAKYKRGWLNRINDLAKFCKINGN